MLMRELRDTDRSPLATMLRKTPAFRDIDVEIALELIDDRLKKGNRSEYQFIVAAEKEVVVGYACYGHIPLTDESFDLYWIVVTPDQNGRGVGFRLIERVKEEILRRGGARIYAETSSDNNYARARSFYAASGFMKTARLPDFYRKGEDKIIYCFEHRHAV